MKIDIELEEYLICRIENVKIYLENNYKRGKICWTEFKNKTGNIIRHEAPLNFVQYQNFNHVN